MKVSANIIIFLLFFQLGCLLVSAQTKRDSLIQLVQKNSRKSTDKVAGQIKGIKSSTEKIPEMVKGNVKKQMDSVFQVKSILQPITSKAEIFKKGKPLRIEQASLIGQYAYFRDSSGIANGLYREIESVYSYQANATVSLINMPFNFSLQGTNGIYSVGSTPFDPFGQFNFDHKKYLEKLRSLAKDKIKPELVVSSVMKQINLIKTGFEKELNTDIQSIQAGYYKKFHQPLNLPEGVTDLSFTDAAGLKTKLMSSGLKQEQVQGYQDRYHELLKSKGRSNHDSISNNLLAEIQRKEALEQVYGKVLSWKSKFDDNRVVKELRSHLPFTNSNYGDYLKNPDNLKKSLKEYGNLSSIQALFTNVTKLDLGKNAVQQGELSMQDVVNSGVNSQFQNKKAAVGFVYGKNENVNNWLQAGLSSFSTNEYTRMSGFRLGTGSGSLADQWISVNFYEFNSTPDFTGRDRPLPSSYQPMGQRKDAVLTMHSGFPIADKHQIDVDLSKSFGTYTNMLGTDSLTKKTANFNTNGGKDNYALSLGYAGRLFGTDFKITGKKTGLGYNNPGNIFLRKGETEAGIGLIRRFLARRLSVKYNFDYRTQVFDPEKTYKFNTVINKTQLGWRFNRNSKANFLWQTNSLHSILPGKAAVSGRNNRIQLDGSYRFRLFGNWVMNNDVASHLITDLPTFDTINYKSKAILISHSSSIAIKKSVLTLLLMANISDNSSYYFNTSFFNAELNDMYPISEKIRLGSGAGFYLNTGWNQQVGINQQLSLTIFKNLTFDLQVSYRKAIQIIKSELADQFFGSASLHYQF